MPLSVINRIPKAALPPKAAFLDLLKKAEKLHPRLKVLSVSLVFVDSVEITKLNKEYRRKDKTTNVLSFTSDLEGEAGDILICPAVGKKEAKAAQRAWAQWANYLFIHGLLHLLGFDHQSKKEEALMEAAAQKILAKYD